MQSREMRFVSAAKWIALQFVATQTGSATVTAKNLKPVR
jgi:hypothetical protein